MTKKYNTKDVPAIIVSQTYNAEEDAILDEPINVSKGKGAGNLKNLKQFLAKYARKTPKEELEVAQQARQDKITEAEEEAAGVPGIDKAAELNATSFEKEVIQQPEACLVYFTTMKEGENLQDEYKGYGGLYQEVGGAIKFAIYRVSETGEELAALKKQYKIKDLKENRPVLRFYPNEVSGDMKRKASIGIPFDRKSSDLGSILEDIDSSFESNIRDLRPEMF